jgi:hypothetical protein
LPKQVALILKLAISSAALVLAFRDLDLSALAGVGLSADRPLMLAAVALSVASVSVLAKRWKSILAPVASPSGSMLLRAQYIGLFGNNALPFRAGEFMRADYVRRKLGKSFVSILGTIFIERSVDLVVVGIMFVALTVTHAIPGMPSMSGRALLGSALGCLAAAALLVRFRQRLAGLVGGRLAGAAEARRLIRNLLTPRGLSALVLASLGLWLLYIIRFQAVLSSIGLPIDPVLVLLLLVATAAGFLIPAAPGAVGTYHVAVVFAMHDLYGVQLVDAQAAAILLHLSAYVPSTLIGFAAFVTASHRSDMSPAPHA